MADVPTGSGDPRDPDPVAPPPPPPAPEPAPPVPQPIPAAGAGSAARGSRFVALLDSLGLLVVLVVLCMGLAAVAGLAWWRAENPSPEEASASPITSVMARDAGLQAATRLTRQVLSYDWRTLDQDVEASREVLAPSFRAEYTKAMEGVKARAVKNRVRLSARAVATSIVTASESRVEALVFVNQVTTAKGTQNRRLDQNRVLVTLTPSGGEWRVSRMDAF